MIIPLYRFTPFGRQINYDVYKALQEIKILIANTNPETITKIIDIYNKTEGEFSNKDFEKIKRMLLENPIFHSKEPSFHKSQRQLIPVYGGTLEKRKLSETDLTAKTTSIKSKKPKTYYTVNFGIEVECFIEITDKFIEKLKTTYTNAMRIGDNSQLEIHLIELFNSETKNIREEIEKLFTKSNTYNIILLSKLLKTQNTKSLSISYPIDSNHVITINDYEEIEIKEFTTTMDLTVDCPEICNLYHHIDNVKENFKNIGTNSVIKFIEFISCVFKSPTDVKAGLEKLNAKVFDLIGTGLFNSRTSSNHIHFSLNRNGEILTRENPEFIMVFISLWIVIEKFILSLCAYFRENDEHCLSIKKKDFPLNLIKELAEKKEGKRKKKDDYNDIIFDLCDPNIFDLQSKYHTLNVSNLFEYNDFDVLGRPVNKPTLEIRVKHGSNDPEETEQFCILIERIVRTAEIILIKLQINKYVPIITFIEREYGIAAGEIDPGRILSFLGCTQIEQEYWKAHIEKIQKFNTIYNPISY